MSLPVSWSHRLLWYSDFPVEWFLWVPYPWKDRKNMSADLNLRTVFSTHLLLLCCINRKYLQLCIQSSRGSYLWEWTSVSSRSSLVLLRRDHRWAATPVKTENFGLDVTTAAALWSTLTAQTSRLNGAYWLRLKFVQRLKSNVRLVHFTNIES